MTCSYVDSAGTRCARDPHPTGFNHRCVFHTARDSRFATSAQDYKAQLMGLINAKDGLWRGFIFPGEIQLINQEMEMDVDARESSFKGLSLIGVKFKGFADFSNSTFDGDVVIDGGTFDSVANFHDCDFLGTFRTSAICERDGCFNGCKFAGPASFAGQIKGNALFTGADFRSSVSFIGSPHITVWLRKFTSEPVAWLSFLHTSTLDALTHWIPELKGYVFKKTSPTAKDIPANPLFGRDFEFVDVNIEKPQFSRFRSVDLARASFIGTDLRGVRFYDVYWASIGLSPRAGVHDEVRMIEGNLRGISWNTVESVYRNIRLSLERQHDYMTANDFYVGEMEARRKQRPPLARNLLSVEFIYKFASNYGISPVRAALVLLLIVVIHSLLTCRLLVEPVTNISTAYGGSMFEAVSYSFDYTVGYIAHSFNVLLFRDVAEQVRRTSQLWVDLLFHVLSIVQTALFVFAIRARIKRF